MEEKVKLPPLPKPFYAASVGHDPFYNASLMRKYAIQAVLEERERAARIAKSFATCPCNGDRGRCTENDVPNAIAAKIRKG